MLTLRHWAGLLAALLLAGASDPARAVQPGKVATVAFTIDGMT